jgi:hypothetical protein
MSRKINWDTCIKCEHYPNCDDVPDEACYMSEHYTPRIDFAHEIYKQVDEENAAEYADINANIESGSDAEPQ